MRPAYSGSDGKFFSFTELNTNVSWSGVLLKTIKRLQMSSINFVLKKFSEPDEYIPAMNKLKKMVKDANITSGDGFSAAWSKIFANWVTDEVSAAQILIPHV